MKIAGRCTSFVITSSRALIRKRPRDSDQQLTSTESTKTVQIRPESQTIPVSSPKSYLHHKKDLCVSHSGRVALPPPPPTSPILTSPRSSRRECIQQKPELPSSLETHVLGMNDSTSKLRYSMHINLHELHQVVLEAGGSELEESIQNLRSVFQRKSPHKPAAVIKPTKQSKQSPLRNHMNRSDKNLSESRPAKSHCTKTRGSDATKLASDQTREEEPEGKPTSDKVPSHPLPPPAQDSQDIGVSGQIVQVLPHDYVAAMVMSRQEEGRMIRKAEKEIMETVTKMRQPPPRPEKAKNPDVLTKDEMAFTRAYTTMNLSAVRAVEKVHDSRKKAEELIQRANHVSKMKREKVKRRGKIENFHQTLRDNNNSWKAMEESRLAQLREQQCIQRTKDIMKTTESRDAAAMNQHRQMEDQTFACEFNQQQMLVSVTLTKEDQRQSKDAKLLEIKEQVQQAREVSQEHQEMVRRYMELRKNKLQQEGATAKKNLDTKMLEVARMLIHIYCDALTTDYDSKLYMQYNDNFTGFSL